MWGQLFTEVFTGVRNGSATWNVITQLEDTRPLEMLARTCCDVDCTVDSVF
jgi:hypothetical protein